MSEVVLDVMDRVVGAVTVAAGVVTATEPWWHGAGSWEDVAACAAVGTVLTRAGVALWRGELWQ